MHKSLFSILVLFFLVGCSPSCFDQSGLYLSAIEPILVRWDDAKLLASSTPRSRVAGSISDLQSIKREVESLSVPDCATPAQIILVEYMDLKIAAFLGFLAKNDDEDVSTANYKAKIKLAEFTKEMEKLKAGKAPYN